MPLKPLQAETVDQRANPQRKSTPRHTPELKRAYRKFAAVAWSSECRDINMNSHSDETEVVRRLFHDHVREVATGIVEIRGVVRDPGYRSVVAVVSKDLDVEPLGPCIGLGGNLVKQIVAELGGEKVDIVCWMALQSRLLFQLTGWHMKLETA